MSSTCVHLLIFDPHERPSAAVVAREIGDCQQRGAVGEFASDGHDAAQQLGIVHGRGRGIRREDTFDVRVDAFDIEQQRAVPKRHAADVGGDFRVALHALHGQRYFQLDLVARRPGAADDGGGGASDIAFDPGEDWEF